jgi:hypothetical protein
MNETCHFLQSVAMSGQEKMCSRNPRGLIQRCICYYTAEKYNVLLTCLSYITQNNYICKTMTMKGCVGGGSYAFFSLEYHLDNRTVSVMLNDSQSNSLC